MKLAPDEMANMVEGANTIEDIEKVLNVIEKCEGDAYAKVTAGILLNINLLAIAMMNFEQRLEKLEKAS